MTIVVNGMKITDTTVFTYLSNPKRQGSKAHARYEIYQLAINLSEYLAFCQPFASFAKADLRYDSEKGHLTLSQDGEVLTPSTGTPHHIIVVPNPEPAETDEELIEKMTREEDQNKIDFPDEMTEADADEIAEIEAAAIEEIIEAQGVKELGETEFNLDDNVDQADPVDPPETEIGIEEYTALLEGELQGLNKKMAKKFMKKKTHLEAEAYRDLIENAVNDLKK